MYCSPWRIPKPECGRLVCGLRSRDEPRHECDSADLFRSNRSRSKSTVLDGDFVVFIVRVDAAVRRRYQPKPQPCRAGTGARGESVQRHSIAIRHVCSGDTAAGDAEAIWGGSVRERNARFATDSDGHASGTGLRGGAG